MKFAKAVLIPFCTISLLVCMVACGGGSSSSSTPSSTTPPPATSAGPIDHVVLVVLENKNYNDVVGSAAMPYLNGLIPKAALATNYFANAHPSIGNYFTMTTGQQITGDDSFTGVVSVDNLARDLTAAGKTWRFYAQSLPSVGYLGPDVYPYDRKHAPFTFFSDVRNSSQQQQNVVPLTQLASDEASGALPNFAMVVPDEQHNSHDCPATMVTCSLNDQMAAADQWLQANVNPLLSKPNTLVIVTFDESRNDLTNGGGHIMTVFLGAGVKSAFRSTTLYQHESLYRFALERAGVTSLPPDAASAPSMAEFLQ